MYSSTSGGKRSIHGYSGQVKPKSIFFWSLLCPPTNQKRKVERVGFPHGIRTVQTSPNYHHFIPHPDLVKEGRRAGGGGVKRRKPQNPSLLTPTLCITMN